MLFFSRANCVWRQRTFHVDEKVYTSFTIISKLTLAARKFSPAQPFRNCYPRFRLQRSYKYDEEYFSVVRASFSNNFSPSFLCINIASSCISSVSQFFLNSKADKVVFLQEKFLSFSYQFFSSRISATCYCFLFRLLPVCSCHIVFKSNLKVKLSCHLHSFLRMFPSPETSKSLE